MAKFKRAIGLLLAVLLIIASVPNQNFLVAHASGAASTYYIDQDGGNDANTGLSHPVRILSVLLDLHTPHTFGTTSVKMMDMVQTPMAEALS